MELNSELNETITSTGDCSVSWDVISASSTAVIITGKAVMVTGFRMMLCPHCGETVWDCGIEKMRNTVLDGKLYKLWSHCSDIIWGREEVCEPDAKMSISQQGVTRRLGTGTITCRNVMSIREQGFFQDSGRMVVQEWHWGTQKCELYHPVLMQVTVKRSSILLKKI